MGDDVFVESARIHKEIYLNDTFKSTGFSTIEYRNKMRKERLEQAVEQLLANKKKADCFVPSDFPSGNPDPKDIEHIILYPIEENGAVKVSKIVVTKGEEKRVQFNCIFQAEYNGISEIYCPNCQKTQKHTIRKQHNKLNYSTQCQGCSKTNTDNKIVHQ